MGLNGAESQARSDSGLVTTWLTPRASASTSLREHYNPVRLHEGIGYVTPDDELHGRGPAIRKARQDGLAQARRNRIATRRHNRHNQPKKTSTDEDN